MRNVLPLVMFVVGVGAVTGLYALVSWLPGHRARRKIESRLSELSVPFDTSSQSAQPATVVKRQIRGALPQLDKIASGTRWGNRLANLINQSGVKIGVSTIVLWSLASAIAGAALAGGVFRLAWAAVPGALAAASLPILVLTRKRAVRLRRFEEQFPEALDLLSRAIRAGHAFTTAMGMVADEAPEPIGPEFKKVFEEQNFGMPLKDALMNLGDRVPIIDVRFFVTAVLIQRETGGNLAEILDGLSHVVRERFKILRQVRVYTAHGRLTGYVLMALPAALALTLSFINPEHIQLLFDEHMGRIMIFASVLMQVTGYIWIRQVIKIEV